ncbi:alpha/beta hydrolase family protein [Streptomyces violaceorubidus]
MHGRPPRRRRCCWAEPPAARPGRARDASPLTHAHRGAPPFLLVHGEEDTMVACSHSRDLAARLEEVGAPVHLRTVPGADHGWYGVSAARVEDVFDQSLRFTRHVTRRGAGGG